MSRSNKKIAVRLRAVKMTDRARLRRIAQIIQEVDNRCLAADGPVTPTLQEMTQDELSRIYALALRKHETWKP
jgi:hypothetical protein